MKLMVIGNGGREHAVAWKLSLSSKVDKIFCVPGNAGTKREEKCENINLETIEEIKNFALKEKVDITFVGPEKYLVDGIVDEFKKSGLKIIGPDKNAAKLEGSKVFSKDFMKKYEIPTADYYEFSDFDSAKKYINERKTFPVVIKADGLAAGKGVFICNTKADALDAIDEVMVKKIFQDSGNRIIVEDFLQGKEASVLCITDGENIIPFIPCKDHKQVYNGDKGPNTGGMGVIAPNPYFNPIVAKDFEEIMYKTLEGMKKENINYTGIIFFGVMITEKGSYLLEYNVRMGDPETQALMFIMKSDLCEMFEAATEKNLAGFMPEWENLHVCCVILASQGYPLKFKKGFPVSLNNTGNSKVFFAGVSENNGMIVTSGGRVMAVVSKAETIQKASKEAYLAIKNVNFENKYFRTDIGVNI